MEECIYKTYELVTKYMKKMLYKEKTRNNTIFTIAHSTVTCKLLHTNQYQFLGTIAPLRSILLATISHPAPCHLNKLFLTLSNQYRPEWNSNLGPKHLSILEFETWQLRLLGHHGRFCKANITVEILGSYFPAQIRRFKFNSTYLALHTLPLKMFCQIFTIQFFPFFHK